VISAIVFGVVFRTQALHYFVLAGMIMLSAGIVVIGRVIPSNNTLTLVGSGLIGVGVGSSVTPALFIAGFSVRSSNLQRVFAIVQLLRAVAAFMIAPVMLHLAATVGRAPTAGTTAALWICFGLSIAGALVGICLYALGGVGPPKPALERWLAEKDPAGTRHHCWREVAGMARGAPPRLHQPWPRGSHDSWRIPPVAS
jgi:hypothetical protein